MDSSGSNGLGLAVALGAGLLIGVERERRKGQGDDREAAGLRSFMVAACSGALAQGLAVPSLVLVGAFLIATLAALAYRKSQSTDPGLTTELALFATYLIGVQSVVAPPLGAACGVGLAGLLVARTRLHRFATELLSEQELQDGLLLAAMALILLPLVPSRPLEWMGGINPRPLAVLALLILATQAAGQVALRLTRCTIAAVAGGRAFVLRVGPSLLASLSLAWLAAGLTVLFWSRCVYRDS